MKFKWIESSVDRGLFWICRSGDSVVGSIAFSYLPSNDGSLFAANRGKGCVSIVVRHNDVVLKKVRLAARSRNEADKLVRKCIRDEGFRRVIESAHVDEVERIGFSHSA